MNLLVRVRVEAPLLARKRSSGPKRPPALTVEQLAARERVDPSSVRRWIKRGCPVAVPGRGHRGPLLDPDAVSTWRSRSLSDGDRMIRALVAKLDAKSRQLARRLVELEGAHVDAVDCERVWPVYLASVRAHATRWLAALTPRLPAAARVSLVALETTLRGAVRGLLLELAAAGGPPLAPEPPRAHPVTPSTTLREARGQFTVLETEWIERRESVATGALRAAVDVRHQWQSRIVAAKARFMSWPATLTEKIHRAVALGDAIEPLVTAALEDALRELEDRRRAPTRGGHDADHRAPIAPASPARASRPATRGRRVRSA